MDLRRVVVVGTSCSGKTTLARRLAAILGSPHVELDALHWQPNWVKRPAEEFRRLVEQSIRRDAWVVDGNYKAVRPTLWPAATAVVWLNFGLATTFTRAFRRTLRRVWRAEELYASNRESVSRAFFSHESILWWVVSTHRRRRRDYGRMKRENEYPQLSWLELRKPEDGERFILSLEASPTRPGGPS
jgi:adenylate kinase family enzyme